MCWRQLVQRIRSMNRVRQQLNDPAPLPTRVSNALERHGAASEELHEVIKELLEKHERIARRGDTPRA